MKKFTRILFAFIVTIFFVSAPNAHALYNASDVIGQLDNSEVPSYLSSTANSGYNAIGFSTPESVALDPVNHRLFVAGGGARILVYTLNSSNAIISHTASYVLGQTNFSQSSTGVIQNTLSGDIRGLAFDSVNNHLYVNDGSNNRILMFDFSGGISNGMNASYVLGQVA